MQKEMFEQWSSFGKNSIKPLVALNAITSRAIERITKQNFEIMNDVFNTQVANLQHLANTKKVEDVVSIQTQILKDSGVKAVDYAQKSLEAFVDASTELSKWFEEGFATAVHNVEKATKKEGNGSGK